MQFQGIPLNVAPSLKTMLRQQVAIPLKRLAKAAIQPPPTKKRNGLKSFCNLALTSEDENKSQAPLGYIYQDGHSKAVSKPLLYSFFLK